MADKTAEDIVWDMIDACRKTDDYALAEVCFAAVVKKIEIDDEANPSPTLLHDALLLLNATVSLRRRIANRQLLVDAVSKRYGAALTFGL